MPTSKATTTLAAAKAAVAGDLAQMRRAPTHPGALFREDFREALGMSQAEAARQLGWTAKRLNEFEREKRAVTAENALALAALTGTGATFWMTAQMRLDLWHALQDVTRLPMQAVPTTKG